MQTKLPPDELEERLFLEMLRLTRKGAGPEFDLQTICEQAEVSTDAGELLRFTAENDGIFGRKNNTFQNVRFTLNADGLRRAREIENLRKPKTIFDHVKAMNRSDWISLGALIVSAIALFKPDN